ncbi:MAG: hypothetical protein RIE52_09950 [Balneola sp.]
MKRVNKIRFRAISDASCIQPSVTTDTLLEFTDLNYSFLQYYRIHGEGVDWYGRLENLGPLISTPLLLKCPPELTELLGIDNFDTVSVSLADIPPLRAVQLQSIKPVNPSDFNDHLEFAKGLKATKDDLFIYKGHLANVVKSTPAIGFITLKTQIEDNIIEEEATTEKLPIEANHE